MPRISHSRDDQLMILPLASPTKLKQYEKIYEQSLPNLRICEPPVVTVEGLDHGALRALGLHEFVNLCLRCTSNQDRQLITEFVSFFVKKSSVTSVRHKIIDVKNKFRVALNLPANIPAEAPPDIDPIVLSTTAHSLMKTYVLIRYKSENSYPKRVRQALSDIQNGLSYTVDFAGLIYKEATKEINDLVGNADSMARSIFLQDLYAKERKRLKHLTNVDKNIRTLEKPKTYNWSCLYSAFWQRLLEFEKLIPSVYEDEAPEQELPNMEEDRAGGQEQELPNMEEESCRGENVSMSSSPENSVPGNGGGVELINSGDNHTTSQDEAHNRGQKQRQPMGKRGSTESIGLYAAQCCECHKWRTIPTKEEFETLRANFTDDPWHCSKRPDCSCEDPADIEYDSSRIWVIDKPNIPKPPPKTERLVIMRGDLSKLDTYYVMPNGKRARCMGDVDKFLEANPEYKDQLSAEDFSFATPKIVEETVSHSSAWKAGKARKQDKGNASNSKK